MNVANIQDNDFEIEALAMGLIQWFGGNKLIKICPKLFHKTLI